MIKIATAECFTYGKIGMEIHSILQNYTGGFGPVYKDYYSDLDLNFDLTEVVLTSSMFIPTLEGVKKILKVKDIPQPYKLIKGIKIYCDEDDKYVSKIMAQSVKNLTGADIGIGTTAGIGYGGISIVTDDKIIVTSSDISADLINVDSNLLLYRQNSAIRKTLRILIHLLNNDFSKIENEL